MGFLQEVAANLNRRKEGFRYSDNSKALAQPMKVYGGQRMCDLFALNYFVLHYCEEGKQERYTTCRGQT